MHDIDFDEIDRAVNNATSGRAVPVPPRAAVATDTVVSETPPVASVVDEPVSPEPVVEPVVTERKAIDTASTNVHAPVPSPAARRSSGRFMDVVHPSSDMRPGQSTTPRTVIEPISADVTPIEAPKVAEPVIVPDESIADKLSEVPELDSLDLDSSEASAFHWPDPIDLAENETPEPAAFTPPSVDPQPVETPAAPAVPTDEIDDDEDDDINDIISAPLESPFLTDAKVEKRPLGAFSTPESELPLVEDFPDVSAPVAPVPVETVAPAETYAPVEEPSRDTSHESHDIPPELHPDLLMLDTHAQDEEVPELLEATNDDAVGTPLTATTNTSAVVDVPVGPTSITQQYKEQASSVSQESGAIYDTDTYHQALTHPPKKRSSVLIIVWIVALILVGGGIGAGFYFVALPMLG